MARRSPNHQIAKSPDARSVLSAALRLLSRRELTIAELRQRLREREFPAADIDQVIERLAGDGTLDDRRAARAIARTQAAVRRRGPQRIARELAARGIPPELAREAVAEVLDEIPRAELLEAALRRRLRSGRVTDRAHFQRLYRYLVRQGFEAEEVVRILEEHASTSDLKP